MHKNIVDIVFGGSTAKNLAISGLLGIMGWTAHTLVNAHDNAQVLEAHTQQLQKLQAGQDQTANAIEGLSVGLAKIDGKLDVVNQKIDDDRHARRAATPR